MADSIDPLTTPNARNPETMDAVDPGPAIAPQPADPNRQLDAQPAPEEETNEQWMHRFIAENAHLARPRPERPPPPPPSPWDGPILSWKVPDHLSLRHRNGGYMAMALFSRTMDDLDEVTKGERAATYEEVDKYFGHALIAEGLVPVTYTADEAIWWWKSGGYKVLGGAPDIVPESPASGQTSGDAMSEPRDNMAQRSLIDMNFNGMGVDDGVDPPQVASDPGIDPFSADVLGPRKSPANDQANLSVSPSSPATGPAPAPAPGPAQGDVPASNGRDGTPKLAGPPPPIVPIETHKAGADWVISADIDKDDIGRLSGRDIIVTPKIRQAAIDHVTMLAVAAGAKEILAYGYLMPDGTIEVRVASGEAGDLYHKGTPSGPGKVIFGIHGHPDDAVGMVDNPSENRGFGDTTVLKKYGIPMATVYHGQIGWHEMVKGQLIFTAPSQAFNGNERYSLRSNLNMSQKRFLAPKEKKKKEAKKR